VSQYLLTPGPLTTDLSVREAMLVDHGSWDDDFRRLSRSIRESILALIDNTDDTYECVLMQGSGTFVVEAMLGTLLPHDSHSLVLINGAYGKRIAQTLEYLGRSFGCIDKGDYLPPQPSEVLTYLNTHPQTTHVVMVHCETSSGILNPINESLRHRRTWLQRLRRRWCYISRRAVLPLVVSVMRPIAPRWSMACKRSDFRRCCLTSGCRPLS